jgi:3-deoxy-D-manno-octulosonic-acid transferase
VLVRIILYNIIISTLGILSLPWVLYQLAFVKKRRQGLAERFGGSPVMVKKTVWCHAVSVGEVRAVAPMLALLDEDDRVKGRIALSTVTVTGQATAMRECGFVKSIFYFPLDLPLVTVRAIRRLNPEIFITAETEIWPNFFHSCFIRDIPVVIVNGRISDTSFPRYLRFRWFFRPFLQRVALFLMQSEEDARRILELGAREESVCVTGNMKYDRSPKTVALPGPVQRWAEKGFLLVAGSTHAGEEEMVLDALDDFDGRGNILLALVPRHPERFAEVASFLESRGTPWIRYTQIDEAREITESILLVDAMGVLDGFYELSNAAFVGGSLVPVGGHNLLEPAMHEVPVLTGPYLHNFKDIGNAMIQAGGCVVVQDREALSLEVRSLSGAEDLRLKMGRGARQVYESKKGASGQNAEEVLSLLLAVARMQNHLRD